MYIYILHTYTCIYLHTYTITHTQTYICTGMEIRKHEVIHNCLVNCESFFKLIGSD